MTPRGPEYRLSDAEQHTLDGRPALTAASLEILDRLSAGQSLARVCEVGRWRGSWTPAEVVSVATHWSQRDPEVTYQRHRRGGRPANPREHGTARGYYQHRSRGEDACDACLAARRSEEAS